MWRKVLVASAGTVAGGLILAVIPKTSDLVVKVVLEGWSAVSWTWGLLHSSHPVPGGVVLVLSLLSLFGLTFIGLLLKESLSGKPETAGPTFRNYTQDILDGVRWRWRWVGNRITDLWCYCPACDAQLVFDGGYTETHLICERCPSDGTFFPHGFRGQVVATVTGGGTKYAVEAAEREILRRIRTGQR